MTEDREHLIAIKKNAAEDVVGIECMKCRMPMKLATEYHPEVFCSLWKEGKDPWEITRKASLATAMGRGGAR